MVRYSGSHFDQALDQPIDGPFHLFTPNIELPDHVQEVVCQKPHRQPGLVGLEPLATGFVPTQGVFAFLDPVLYLGPAVIDLGHFGGREPGAGDHKADPGEKLARMPLDLGDYPARPTPTLGLVVEVHDLDLNAALGRSADRTTEMRRHQPIQVFI